MKVAVLGARGFIGSFVSEQLAPDFEIEALDIDDLDITDNIAVDHWASKTNSDSIINFVAYTNVDQAEVDRDLALSVNQVGAENIAIAAQKYKKFLVHISTDFIFPGTPDYPGPYNETDFPNKKQQKHLGWYGYTKLLGEIAVKQHLKDHALVRINLPFGHPSSDRDLIRKTIAVMEKGYPLFNDQFVTHTYLPDLAKALKLIVKKQKGGVFHVSTNTVITPFDLGTYINRKMNSKFNLSTSTIKTYLQKPGVAPRPILGGLDCSITQKSLQLVFAPIEKALDNFFHTL